MIDIKEIKKVIKNSNSRSSCCKTIWGYANGRTYKKFDIFILEHKIDTSHFGPVFKVKRIEKICPVCESKFTTKKDHKDEKTTCSHACSNTHFRSGVDNGNWKDVLSKSNYAKVAYRNYEHKCDMCGFDKKYALEVHHIDCDRTNHDVKNLVILCANCHNGIHYGDLVYERKI